MPITQIPIDRGCRYAGTSKMNYVSLIVHGLSGISVYSDVIFVRMLAATGGLFVLSVVAIASVISIRLDPRTVNKMMRFSLPPGYVRKNPPAKPKLDPFILVIDAFSGMTRPKKQQHRVKRLFERLRDEHGFTGGITIVKDYVAGWRQRAQEMFVPLVHPPGHAQADFGEAIGIIGGVERKIHFFAFWPSYPRGR